MKSLFASIAARYDGMNRVMSLGCDRRWRRASLASVDLPPQATVLDVACGTGDFTEAVLQRFPTAAVTGVDLTPEMLAIARRKLAGCVHATFREGDAQTLAGFPDAAFDLAVCAFGFRNFPAKEKALAACRRVLKPTGRLIVLELFRPRSRVFGALVNAWLAAVAFVFAHGARKAYAYLRRSVAGTVSASEFCALAEAEGFTLCGRRAIFPSATLLVLRPSSPGRIPRE